MAGRKVQPRTKTFILTGLKSALATLKKRPESIQEVYFDKTASENVTTFLKPRGDYRPQFVRGVKNEELKKISGGLSHEGIALRISAPVFRNFEGFPFSTTKLVLAIDHISNPHNYGALMRVAAFLGVNEIIQERHELQARPSGSAMRVSQGAFEYVNLYEVSSLFEALKSFKNKGFSVVGADVNQSIPFRSSPKGAMVLVLGNEENGLSAAVKKVCDYRVVVPGAELESLNVVVAAGILLEHYRQISS